MPTLQRFRWFGHHADIDVVVRGESVRFVAIDVLRALDIDPRPWFVEDAQPGQDSPTVDRIEFCTSWSAAEIEENLGGNEYAAQAVYDLTDWARAVETTIRENLAAVERESTPIAQRVRALDPVATVPADADSKLPASYSVQQAAEILSRDPAITMTRAALFDVMAGMRWVTRLSGRWRATQFGINRSFLIVINRKLPADHADYLQPTITSAGLDHLHKHLGGVARIELDPTTTRNEELSL